MVALHATARAIGLSLFVICLVLWPIPADTDTAQPEFERVDPSEYATANVPSLSGVIGSLRRRRGRPRKFDEPSRAITLTLPDAVIERLTTVDRDLSRAVAEIIMRRPVPNGRPYADLLLFGEHAVITVKPTRALERRAGIGLVPLPDGRALISFDQPRTISELELILSDALDDPTLLEEDRRVFEGIVAILREARRSEDVALLHRSIIVLRASPRRREAAVNGRRKGAAARGHAISGGRRKS
jgi:hypothetical protein